MANYMNKKIIISAYNIHQGGGKVLLNSLLHSIDDSVEVILLHDSRFTPPRTVYSKNFVKLIHVNPNPFARFKAEFLLWRTQEEFNTLICFGNLPPLFKSKRQTVVYVQNRYLISKQFICWTNLKTTLRTLVEKVWFELRKARRYTYVVQTPTMRRALEKCMGTQYKCKMFGFSEHGIIKYVDGDVQNSYSEKKFIYVASGEPHKNHKNVISAWIELAGLGVKPQLTLVLDTKRYSKLFRWINEKTSKKNINLVQIDHIRTDDLAKLYKDHDALVFPSLFESFGLPLLEASEAKIDIIASELDYVRDLVNPAESFDPLSSVSISRSILRYLNSTGQAQIIQSKEQNAIHKLTDLI